MRNIYKGQIYTILADVGLNWKAYNSILAVNGILSLGFLVNACVWEGREVAF